jgi:hypothetical protein
VFSKSITDEEQLLLKSLRNLRMEKCLNNSLNKELKLISRPDIRTFVKECLEKAPEYFWTIPSSSTGKYHPEEDNGVGGLVIHTKKVVKLADDLCRNYEIIGDERDCVIAAAIMHDTCKGGFPENSGNTVSGHGSLWINIAEQVIDKKILIGVDYIKLIGRLISTHMGRWDEPFINNYDVMSNIIQVSDYIASRKYVKVDVS